MKKRFRLALAVLAGALLCPCSYFWYAHAKLRPGIGMTVEEVERLMGPSMDGPMRERAKVPFCSGAWQTRNGAYYVEFENGRACLVRFVPNAPGLWTQFREWVGL